MFVRQMRPRFRLPVPMSADDTVRLLQRRLADEACPCRGSIAGNHRVIDLRVLEDDRHFWSPALSLTVAETGEGAEEGSGERPGAVVHGIVGPNPNVWTLFAMGYMGLLTLLTGFGIFGLVQYWLQLRPWGLYVVPLLVLAMVAMYMASRVGQGLAAPQTALLRHFVEDALGLSDHERQVTDRDPYHERPAVPGPG